MTAKRKFHEHKDRQMLLLVAGVFSVLVVFCLGVFLVFAYTLLSDFRNNIPLTHSKDLLGPLAASLALVVALFALVRDWNKFQIDKLETAAKILYEQGKSGLETVYDLLKDKPQDTMVWEHAARLILQSQEMGRSIHEYSYYSTAYKIAEDNLRFKLRQILSVSGNPLPLAFFQTHCAEPIPSPQADFPSTADQNSQNGGQDFSGPLNIHAVAAVYMFIDECLSNTDPLKRVPVKSMLQKMGSSLSVGARAYIQNHLEKNG